MNPLALAGFFALVFGAVLAGGALFLSRRSETEPAVPAPSPGPSVFAADDAADPDGDVSTEALLAEIGERIVPAKDTDRFRSDLIAAGYRAPDAVPVFHGIKAASGAVLGLAFGLVTYIGRGDWTYGLVALVAAGGFGYLIPDRVLEWQIRARRERIRRGVPPALDLMVMAVEAGQSVNQAIMDASHELRDAYPDLASEFAQVNLELRAGKSRADSLLRLGERNREAELKKLSSLLIDADRFGSSLGPAMRTHAKYLRTRSRQQAQEKARKVAVKMVFPIFFLIFPSILLVTLGPAVVRMMDMLGKYLN